MYRDLFSKIPSESLDCLEFEAKIQGKVQKISLEKRDNYYLLSTDDRR